MQEEKGATEDEMAGWHNPLNGQEFGHLWEILKAGGEGNNIG